MLGNFKVVAPEIDTGSIYPKEALKSLTSQPKYQTNKRLRSFKLMLQKIVINNQRGLIISGLLMTLCLFTTIFHIYLRYKDIRTLFWFDVVDQITCSIYALEFLLRFYVAPQRIDFILSYSSFLDIAVIFTFFAFEWTKSDVSWYFISISRLVRIARLIDFVLQLIKTKISLINRQIFTIVATIVLLTFVSSGIIQLFENLSFHDALYFSVVTISTIGYGDIVPKTAGGKTVVIGLIIVTFIIIPKQIGDLITLINMRSVYSRAIYKKNEDIDHLVVTGNIEIEGATTFCSEVFHPDHGNYTKHVVLLQESEPSQEVMGLLRNPQYELLLVYLRVVL
jgi:voltage-gated potassium channel